MRDNVKDIRGMPPKFEKKPPVQWPFITTEDGPKTLVPRGAPPVDKII